MRPQIIVEVRKLARVYPRVLTSGMVYPLLLVYSTHPRIDDQWLNVDDILVKQHRYHDKNRDFTRLKHWDFVEPKPGERNDGSKNLGLWRLTKGARTFIEGATCYKVAYVFEDKRIAYSDGKRHEAWPFKGELLDLETTTVRASLGKRFSFDEVMGRK